MPPHSPVHCPKIGYQSKLFTTRAVEWSKLFSCGPEYKTLLTTWNRFAGQLLVDAMEAEELFFVFLRPPLPQNRASNILYSSLCSVRLILSFPASCCLTCFIITSSLENQGAGLAPLCERGISGASMSTILVIAPIQKSLAHVWKGDQANQSTPLCLPFPSLKLSCCHQSKVFIFPWLPLPNNLSTLDCLGNVGFGC